MEEQINVAQNHSNVVSKKKFSLKSFSFVITVIFSFLLPIFFIPAQTFSFLAGKELILTLTVFLLLVAWLIEKIVRKDFAFSFNIGVIALVVVPLTYLLSSLFSGSIKMTLLGANFNITSFSVITTLFLLIVLTARLFENKKQIITLYLGLMSSFIVVSFYHLLRLVFGPEFLSFGLFSRTVSNFVGTWNELGIFFGLIAILSFLAAFSMKESKWAKVIGYIILALSLFFVALVNSAVIWVALALFFIAFFVYNLVTSRNKTADKKISKKPVSWLSIILAIVSLVFVFAQGPVGGFLPSLFGISNYEVVPLLGSTFDVAQTTLSNAPILGAGPGQFSQQWAVNKPLAINNTQFWNTNFGSGVDFVLTSLVEVGLLGFLAWLLFLVAIVYLSWKLLKVRTQNKFNHFIHLSVFFATLYLWSFAFLYNPGVVTLGLSALFTGILFSLSFQEKTLKLKSLSKKSIVLVIVSVLLGGGFVYMHYFFVQRVVASVSAQKSLTVLNTEGDLGKSIKLMRQAVGHFENDEYYRSLTELDLYQLNAVLSQEDVDEETLQTQFQGVFQNAVADAQMALQVNMNNYQNWLNLGGVYGTAASLEMEGAYDQAIQAYNNAVSLNPNNPLLVLSLANLEAVNGDTEKAKEYAMAALQRKNNYSDAYSFLAQIESNNDNQEEALNIINAWAQAAPNDPEPFLQLGAFAYNAGNYEEATPLLEQAAALNPNSLDTLYLLGLTYDKAGENEKALNLFNTLSQAMPEDENLKTIFENIQNGRDALYGFNQQQQASELPMEKEVVEEEMPEEETPEEEPVEEVAE